MVLPSQFSLSLELTRLVPLGLATARKTYDAAMILARSLQSSGSDIVVEEDLLELFGRSRIAPQLESRFRRDVSVAKPPRHLCADIVLYDGPGPTVNRACTGETAYLSMVTQCSFLVSIFDKSSLAATIAYHFEKQKEGVPYDQLLRAVPSRETIRGVLRACEDQTSSFSWRDVILPIGMVLGIPEEEMFQPIPAAVLRGLIGMLPLVQHFPEDRLIYIETGTGVCSIVAWAHVILGLSVVVNSSDDFLHQDSKEYRFGTSHEQLTIFRPIAINPSITLLSAATKDALLKFTEEPDEEEITSTAKISALGYGTKILNFQIYWEDGRENLISEISYVTTAFAICVSRSLVISRSERDCRRHNLKGSEYVESGLTEFVRYKVSEDRIYEAACFIFGNNKLKRKKIEDYVVKYTERPIYGMETPSAISAIVSDWPAKRKDRVWSDSCLTAAQLCVLVLAFAHVVDLEACSKFEMCQFPSLLATSELSTELAKWDGKAFLPIRHLVWFEVIALLLVGHTETIEDDRVCLFSNWGWSIYINTLGTPDPSSIEPGFVSIKKGVPMRNGIWKHKIFDGPGSIQHGGLEAKEEVVAACGKSVSLSCLMPVEYGPPLIGERGDSFIVSLRLQAEYKGTMLMARMAYGDLFAAMWSVMKSHPCSHGAKLGDQVVLPPGSTAVSRIDTTYDSTEHQSLVIVLTALNPAARWLALVHICQYSSSNEAYGFTPVMLRGPDCCFQCVLDQTMRQAGKGPWCIVL